MRLLANYLKILSCSSLVAGPFAFSDLQDIYVCAVLVFLRFSKPLAKSRLFLSSRQAQRCTLLMPRGNCRLNSGELNAVLELSKLLLLLSTHICMIYALLMQRRNRAFTAQLPGLLNANKLGALKKRIKVTKIVHFFNMM